MTRPPPSGGTRHIAAFPRARQAPRWLRGGRRGAVNSAMEPEPDEDEEQQQAAAAAATE
eukprot:COSAG01_NODE_15026_length_1383_cov_3.263240_1_plen_58_part_10